MYIKPFAAALLIAGVTANYGSEGGAYSWGDWSSTSTSEIAAATPNPAVAATQPGEMVVQIVSVSDSNGSLKYYPESVQAAPGTIVQFQFHPKNHTITESSFAEPCKPLAANLTSPTRPGIKSGFVPVTGSEESMPVYNLLVNDTKPIWLYCGQTNHCQKGMVMVINQNMSQTVKTLESYKAAAIAMPLAQPPSSSASPPPAIAATQGSASLPSSTLTAEVLPQPTSTTLSSATISVAPATFTGSASRTELIGIPAFAGLLFGGVFAIW